MYKALFNLFFRRLDAEFAHQLGALIILLAGLLPGQKSKHQLEVAGITFSNRIGMAAGFD